MVLEKKGSSSPNVPPNAALTYEIELVDFKKSKEHYEYKVFEDVLSGGMERKEQGNRFFTEQRFANAIKKYEKAMKIFDQTSSFTDEEKASLKNNKLPCHLNLSLAFLKENNHKKALEQANKALEIDSNNVKGLYRRGLVEVELDDWDSARRDYDRCLELEPDNVAVKKAKANLNKIVAKQEQKDKKRYKNMFSRLERLEKKEAAANTPEITSNTEQTPVANENTGDNE